MKELYEKNYIILSVCNPAVECDFLMGLKDDGYAGYKTLLKLQQWIFDDNGRG